MPKARVLICDDNPALQKSLTGYFEAENMEVVCADTGEEALERLREDKIDLLILDVMLPGISGTEVLSGGPQDQQHADPDAFGQGGGDRPDRGSGGGRRRLCNKALLPPGGGHPLPEAAEAAHGFPGKRKKYTLAELTVLPDSYEVYIGEQRVNLASKEFEVLRYLSPTRASP